MRINYIFIYSLFILFFIIFTNTNCQKSLTSIVGKALFTPNDHLLVGDTILEVYTVSDSMFAPTDTLHMMASDYFPVGYYYDQYFGGISASLYLQLKPYSYPYYLPYSHGLVVDSAVLGLKFAYLWGDSTLKNTVGFSVNQITDNNFTIANISQYFKTLQNDISISPDFLAHNYTINIRNRYDSFYSYGEAVKSQYRIKLDNSIGITLLNAYMNDTSAFNGDAKFNTIFQGLKISPDISQGNCINYFSILDSTTRLSIYYHYKIDDSTYYNIAKFYYRNDSGAYATKINKTPSDRFNNHYANYTTSNNNQIFMETQPGGFTLLQIPQLDSPYFKNTIINQAMLLMEVDPSYYNLMPGANKTIAPFLLYLDEDSLNTGIYRPLPYDLNYLSNYTYFPITINYGYFGGQYIDSVGIFTGYKINISRTIQNNIRTAKTGVTYRLYSPLMLNYGSLLINYGYANKLVGAGRTVMIGNYKGTNKNNPHRIRLRLIYTKNSL